MKITISNVQFSELNRKHDITYGNSAVTRHGEREGKIQRQVQFSHQSLQRTIESNYHPNEFLHALVSPFLSRHLSHFSVSRLVFLSSSKERSWL